MVQFPLGVALCFIYIKHTILCHLETIYYERGDSQFSFTPKIFKFWYFAGQIYDRNCTKNAQIRDFGGEQVLKFDP